MKKHLKEATYPILLYHGDADLIIPTKSSKWVHKNIGTKAEDKHIKIYPKVHHLLSSDEDWPLIKKDIFEFMDKYVLSTAE